MNGVVKKIVKLYYPNLVKKDINVMSLLSPVVGKLSSLNACACTASS